MIRLTQIIEVFVTSMLVSYAVTPLVRKIALKADYLDRPKGTKVHAHPTPLLGGVAIYIAFLLGLFTTVNIAQNPKILALILGCTFLLIVGLIDDKMGMMPEVKLLGQFFAAMVVIKSGVRIEFLHDYYLNTIITYIWIIGITNSFNLLDNMNGLSAGIASIASMFFGVILLMDKQPTVAVISFAMGGASLGFLKHNFPNAAIFMGDAGSLVVGFVLSSIAALGSWHSEFTLISVFMPIIVLAYPIFDTTLVTIVRLLEGRSIFHGGKDHSSHRLALLGLKRKNAVIIIYLICISLGFSVLFIQKLPFKSAVLLMATIGIAMLGFGIRLVNVKTGRFGRHGGDSGID